MPGKKTSVWLGTDELAKWKDSGDSLTDIVKRGLAAPKAEAAVSLAELREELSALEDRLSRKVRDEIERAAGRA